MAIPQYTSWVTAPNPTSLNRVRPILSWAEPPTMPEDSIITTRTSVFQWNSTKLGCQYQYKGSWQNTWSDWNESNIYIANSLPNGAFVFSVKAKDLYGNISEELVKHFIVYREISIPEPIAPNSIIPNTDVTFVCTVPSGETGQTYHFEFQIAYWNNSNTSMNDLVNPAMQWFSSVNVYAGFSYDTPVPENRGGTVSFTKTLATRRKYLWRCRIRLAGTDRVSAMSEIVPFTVGVLGTKIVLASVPEVARADGSSRITINARIEDALGQLDPLWVGSISFVKSAGVAQFVNPDINGQILAPINLGVSTIQICSSTINSVNVAGNANYLDSGNVTVNFVANRLPVAPTWLPEDVNSGVNLEVVSATVASVTMTIPSDQDGDKLHVKLEMDVVDTFDSPDLIVAETRFNQAGWEYYDGANWVVFPVDGVVQGQMNGLIRYTTPIPLVDDKTYYCRVAAWDNYAR